MGKGQPATTAQRRFTYTSLLLLFLLLAPAWGWGQTTLANFSFENNLTPDAGAVGSASIVKTAGFTFSNSGNPGNELQTSTTNSYLDLSISTLGYSAITISWDGRQSVGTGGSWKMQASDGVNWTGAYTQTLTGGYVTIPVQSLGYTFGDNNRITIRIQATIPSAGSLEIDNLVVKGTINSQPRVTPTELSCNWGFVANGQTSVAKGFYLLGEKLNGGSGNLILTSSPNFELSLDQNIWSTSVNVPYSSSTSWLPYVYVRFKPSAVNVDYRGKITIAGGGVNQEMSVTGNSIVTYCDLSVNSLDKTSLTGVQFNTISNISGKNNGYADYTSISTTLTQGKNYNLTTSVNTDGNYLVKASAWIDWNQSGTFELAEHYDLGQATNTSNGITSESPLINVPSTAALGSTRMRVVVQYNDSPASCGTVTYGEVEDYTINVAPNIAAATYYSYQTGLWNMPTTWTSDPSGTTQVGSTIPGPSDNVVILTNRTVTLSGAVGTAGLNVTINDGGGLDLATYQLTAGLNSLSGQGTLRIGSAYFPAATANSFVQAGGGTTEFYNATSFTLPSQGTYNHLRINAPGITATQMSNITLNGNLLVKAGSFRINDNSSNVKKQLTVNGNIVVEATGAIAVGNGTTYTDINTNASGGTAPYLTYYENFHRVVVYGSLTNNGGSVRFTNLAKPQYGSFPPAGNATTSGAATVYFRGSDNATLLCDGTTDFYNLILDKNDPAISLTIDPSTPKNFRLFGANTLPFDGAASANPNMRKALWIRTGSLVLKGAAAIPSLSEGVVANSDYFVPANGSLVLDGPDVVVLSTADDYREVNVASTLSSPAASNAELGITTNGRSSLGILGRVQVNDGYLSTRESAGITYWSYGSGQLIVNRGIVDAKQIADASGGNTGLFNYIQNGGSVLLRGRLQHQVKTTIVDDLTLPDLNSTRADNGVLTGLGTFSINSNSSSGFTMTGGSITIYDACTTGDALAFQVGSPAANINVIGGTLQLYPTSGTNAADVSNLLVSTTAPIGNLTINRVSGTAGVKQSTNIYILNNINLSAGVLDANGKDVYVGGNFTIAGGTSYANANSTIFNGPLNQLFTVNVASPLSLNKLKVDKVSSSSEVAFAGLQKVVSISDSLTIINGKLNDSGNTINALGTIYSSGVHYGTGKIALVGANIQGVNGNGSAVFGNVELNNTTNAAVVSVILGADATITGTLTFMNAKLFDIGSNGLTFTASGSIVGAAADRYIQTSGQAGDGGITFTYSSSKLTNTFPVGAKGAASTSHSGVSSYTPATIGFTTGPTTLGTITVTPVGYEHPSTTTKNQSLTGFWKVKSSGFTGIAANSVTHSFSYSQSDVVAAEASYLPAYYERSSFNWRVGTAKNPPINTTTNTITDWSNPTNSSGFLDGDYTAGVGLPTSSFGSQKVFYSRINGLAAGNGLWSSKTTWSTDNVNKHSGAAASSVPGVNDIVIIGGKDSVYLATNTLITGTDIDPVLQYYKLDEASVRCASLKIEKGSVLDIQNNPGSNFGIVLSHESGNGNFRVATRPASGDFDNPCNFIFPSGDFSDYNANGGTTEFYSVNYESGTIMILPNNARTYGNVILSPLGGSNIIFPNISSVNILGDLITRGQDWRSWLAMTWDSNYGPIVPKSVHVKGSMYLQGGTFIYMNNGSTNQDITIDGDVIVYPGAGIDVYGASAANIMRIGGSLINNSNDNRTYTLDGNAGSNVRFYVSNTRKCDVVFFSGKAATISNTGATPSTGSAPNTIFGNVTINKGISQATTLTCNIGGTLTTPNDNWLSLQNGFFRYERTGTLDISTNTSFAIPSTAGLYVNTPSDVNIAVGNVSTNTVSLSGKLTLVNGNLIIGNTANGGVSNNIEYSSGGDSEIEISGGKLMVNGQIRRNPLNAAGVLGYTQTGGAVTLSGNKVAGGANSTLEVLNTGSRFNMSGGSINILKGGGGANAFGDLYLRPESSTVSGGTIIFGTNSGQTFKIDASVPLYNFTINGSGGANTVNLMVNPLVLKGTLMLSNTNSFLKTNGIDVTIKGSLTNNGNAACYDFGTNTTSFSGGVQNINGTSAATNFYNLKVNPVTSLAFTNSFTVNGDLDVASGTLICSAKKVTVKGNLNVANSATYTDVNGGVVLTQGGAQHQISGLGTFGTLELNNVLGATLLSSISLHSNLVMTAGILDINRHLLSLSTSSHILGAPFSTSKMITSDGVFSNVGILKFFKIGATNFTYPLGSGGKYTPAIMTVAANSSVGSIRVNNINDHHPSVLDANRALKYFWEVESASLSGFAGNMVLSYNDNDVKGAENQYVAAKILVPGADWYKAATGTATDNVDESQDRITFQFPAGTSSISGEYTAGEDPAFPAVVKTYTSIANGSWSDKNIWSPIAPDGGPNGAIVVVKHDVTVGANYTFSYRTAINGTLKVDPTTYGHNLGTVTGSGKLHLESGLLPAGRFDAFFDCASNSTLEYGGLGNYTIIADLYSSIANLSFTGSGIRYYPNKNLTVCKVLNINGPTLDNSLFNKKLTILGEMQLNSGGFVAGSGGDAVVSFAGATKQSISTASNAFVGANKFNSIEINNAAGLDLMGQLEMDGNLYLTNGVVNTSTTNKFTITNSRESCIYPAGGSEQSYINGPLTKKINPGDYFFVFPVGDGRYGYQISVKSTFSTPELWTVQYVANNPTYLNLTDPLLVVNSDEYWKVSVSNTSAKGYIKLGWDSGSGLTPLMTQNGIGDMRVAEYKSSRWTEVGSLKSGDAYTGAVEMANLFTFSNGSYDFTTGSITSIMPKAKLSPTGPVCGAAGIPVTITKNGMIMTFPYTLGYLYNGAPMIANITSEPYTLPTPSSGVYKLVSFAFNNGAKAGVVDSKTVVTSYANPTTADAGSDQSLCGATGATLAGNLPAIGSGLWSITAGAGGSVPTPTLNTSTITGVNGASYTVLWTIDNGGCKSTDAVQIHFTLKPNAPIIASPQAFCSNAKLSDVVATVGSGTTLKWYSNGVGGVEILPSTTISNGSTYYALADNGCQSDTRTPVNTNITPNVSVSAISFAVGSEPKCKLPNGSTATTYLSTIANQTSYTWSIDNALAGLINATSGIVTWSDGFAGTVNVKVEALGCGPVATATHPVVVNSLPVPTLSAISPTCAGSHPVIGLTQVYTNYLWSITTANYSLSQNNIANPKLITPANDLLFPEGNTDLVSYPDVKVVVTDANGCQNSVTNNSTDKKITIHRIPRTGPPYHVGNNVAK